MAKRMYVSDWAAKRIEKIAEKENKPFFMVIEEAIAELLKKKGEK